MKTIVFLVLAGLSLAAGDTNPAARWDCLFKAVEKTPSLFVQLVKFICEYRQGVNNYENYKKSFDSLDEVVRPLGCHVDEILATQNTVEETALSVDNVAEHAGWVVTGLTDALGLTPTLTDTLCRLASDALLSQCLAELLKGDLKELIKKLDELFCKNDLKALSAYEIFKLLQKVGCFADEALGSKDAVEELFKTLGNTAAPLVQNILVTLTGALDNQIPGGLAGPGGLTCSLIDIVSGEGLGKIVGGVVGGGSLGDIGGVATIGGGIVGGVATIG